MTEEIEQLQAWLDEHKEASIRIDLLQNNQCYVVLTHNKRKRVFSSTSLAGSLNDLLDYINRNIS